MSIFQYYSQKVLLNNWQFHLAIPKKYNSNLCHLMGKNQLPKIFNNHASNKTSSAIILAA